MIKSITIFITKPKHPKCQMSVYFDILNSFHLNAISTKNSDVKNIYSCGRELTAGSLETPAEDERAYSCSTFCFHTRSAASPTCVTKHPVRAAREVQLNPFMDINPNL